jgi:hypothetical protein
MHWGLAMGSVLRDPDYVSPTAGVVQHKAAKLLGSALAIDGLSQAEVEYNDLENVLLAETKDHADWHVLSQLAEQASSDMKKALQAALDGVESEEDEHLEWGTRDPKQTDAATRGRREGPPRPSAGSRE